jgi:omega-6 fatty acid desaturase (delta-12 desaturase)
MVRFGGYSNSSLFERKDAATPRVPNYRLAECHHSNAFLRSEKPLSLGRAFGASSLTLWDEAQGKLVRFRDAI